MLRKIPNLLKQTPLISPPIFTFTKAQPPQPTQPKLSDKPSHLSSETIQKQHPELYKILQKQAQQLEKKAIRDHQVRFNSIKKRIGTDSVKRVDKISQILAGLSKEEIQYVQFQIYKKVENVE